LICIEIFEIFYPTTLFICIWFQRLWQSSID